MDFLKLRSSLARGTLTLLVMLSVNVSSFAEETWFNQRVTWKYGNQGAPWKTTIRKPNGPEEYQLVLQPLWALEGGVVALEIVLARPQQPELNSLGERENGVEYPFVITVEELERGGGSLEIRGSTDASR